MVLTVYVGSETRSDKFKEDNLQFPQLHTKNACFNKTLEIFFESNRVVSVHNTNLYFTLIFFLQHLLLAMVRNRALNCSDPM